MINIHDSDEEMGVIIGVIHKKLPKRVVVKSNLLIAFPNHGYEAVTKISNQRSVFAFQFF
jgi:hypothetical protein